MADPHTYGHHDIERYLHHKMTHQEMHAFEKALMDDPFLADALEGFSTSDSNVAERHLSEIENELKGEGQKTKVVAMPLQKKIWWKVAAVVLVAASGGILSYSLLMKKGIQKDVAEQVSHRQATEMTTKADTSAPVEKPLAKAEIAQDKKQSLKYKNTAPTILEEKANSATTQPIILQRDSQEIAMLEKNKEHSDLIKKKISKVPDFDGPVNSSASRAMSVTKTELAPGLPEYELKGRILDQTRQPVAGATVAIKDSNTKTLSDSVGNFILRVNDSLVKINITSRGIMAKDTNLRSNGLINNIIVDRENTILSEAVVADSNKPRINNNIAEAVPDGGWQRFERYFEEKKNSSINYSDNNDKHQQITLEFSIDKNGRPEDVKVVGKADKAIAEKAIDILINGPLWKSKDKKQKVQLILPF